MMNMINDEALENVVGGNLLTEYGLKLMKAEEFLDDAKEACSRTADAAKKLYEKVKFWG